MGEIRLGRLRDEAAYKERCIRNEALFFLGTVDPE
jgi:hypothetical protein